VKLTIEHTDRIVDVNGVPARVWEGVSDTGIPCVVLVTRIAVALGHDQTAFEQDLQEQRPPSPVAERVFDLRSVL
jgi:hypothetical protein